MKYPLSEELTFRSSKQKIKFNNYGGFLALAYFVGDQEVFEKERCHVGVVISNEEVKEIYKLSADGYQMPTKANFSKNRIMVEKPKENKLGVILIERTS